MRESRSLCSAMIPRRRSGASAGQLVGVGADARQRRLQVVGDAAQEVVLGRVELPQALVLVVHAREQLGVAQAHADDRREQLEEVLVGALPARGGRGVAHQQAERLGPGAKVGADRQRDRRGRAPRPGCPWVAQHDPGVDHPEGRPGIGDREVHESVGALARRVGAHGVDHARHLPVAAKEVGGEPVLALGEAAQLVVRELRERRVRSPAATRSSVVASARSGAVRLPATTNASPRPAAPR